MSIQSKKFIPLRTFDPSELEQRLRSIREEKERSEREFDFYQRQLEELERRYLEDERVLREQQEPSRLKLRELKKSQSSVEKWDDSPLEAVLEKFKSFVPEFPRTTEYQPTSSEFTKLYVDLFDLPKSVEKKYLRQLGHLFPCTTEIRVPRSQGKRTIGKLTSCRLLTGHPEFSTDDLEIMSKFRVKIVYIKYDKYSRPQYSHIYEIKVKK